MEYAFQSSKSWSEGLFFQVLHESTLLVERTSDRGDVVVGLSAVSLILAWPNAFSVLSSLTEQGLIFRFAPLVTHSISYGSRDLSV